MGLVRRLSPRAAAEFREDIADIHLDRPWTQKEFVPDLPVRPAHADQAQDFALPPREASMLELRGGPPTQAPLDLLAQRGKLPGSARGEGSCAELARDPERVGQARHRRFTLSRCRQGHAGSHLRLRARERRFQPAQEIERVVEVVGSPRGIAFQQCTFAERVRQPGQRFHIARGGGDLRERVRAGPCVGRRSTRGEEGRCPLQRGNREVPILGPLPPVPDKALVIGRRSVIALELDHERQAQGTI